MATEMVPGTLYTIGGVKVDFPCKAYPTQLSMMSMIIKGIERRQNCLLESPTGSGKSLALLCSCLAWQQNEYKKRDEESNDQVDFIENDFKENIICTCDCGKTSPMPPAKPCTVTSPPNNLPVENGATLAHPCSTNGACQPLTSNGNCCNQDTKPRSLKTETTDEDEDEDVDFQPSKKRYRTPGAPGRMCKKGRGAQGVVFEDPSDDNSPDAKTNTHTEVHWQMKLKTESSNDISVGEDYMKPSCQCLCHSSKEKDLDEKPKEAYKRRKIPRIYFGTRTHKQITQIVRELGKTAYKDVPMCILGSREYTCVHPDVSRGFNKNDGCKELLEGRNGLSCRYYNGAHKIKNQWQLRDRGLTQAWDIEDLVKLGKKIKACPYFAVRSLKDEADIVFCPYNYLVDPMIRMTMDINMRNQIVVLDEAHNIEDSARDAASCSVTVDQLEDTVTELDHHITQHWREPHCRVMHSMGAALLRWVQSHSSHLTQRDFERALRVWSGSEIVKVLQDFGITKDTLASFQHHLAALVEEAEPLKKEQENGVALSSSSGMTLKGLFLIFGFLFKDDMKYMKDFKVAIVRTMAKASRFKKADNRWISKKRYNYCPEECDAIWENPSHALDQSWTMTLNFWCLNPAVAFTDFGEDVRSIILTSGTLSPMASFQSELGVAFPIQLEANHVVHMSQVWVGTVAIGTNGGSLNGSYKNAETYSFQDEIGLLLLQVCQVVPYGVLCFLPSYGMMSKLSQRWKNTGLWDQLEKVKVVMSEARGADKINFDEHLREFYEVIKDCENTDIENQTVTGAVFLAVCRGKVSEGMDFADNNARAVMTIGIPFPSIMDTQVELKRQYNDQYSACRGLLTGSEWYEIQAYRAINQALGRCIRHKRDWGALILVDDRYGRNPKKYITGLSKWVRGKVVHHTHAMNALTSLGEFAKARLQSPCPELPSLSQSMCASPSPSQSLNATFTLNQEPPMTQAPPTPSSPRPIGHNDSGMSNVLRAMAFQAQQSQTPAVSTPLKFFSSAGGPSTPGPVGCRVPWTRMPSIVGPVCNTPSTLIQTPVVYNAQQLVPGPLYMIGPNNLMIPLQGKNLAHSPPAITPSALQGKVVEEVDGTGKKVVKQFVATPGHAMPTHNQVQNIPPPRAVVPSSLTAVSLPSAGTTPIARDETLLRSKPLYRVGPGNFTVPVQSNITLEDELSRLKEVTKSRNLESASVGVQSGCASTRREGASLPSEDTTRYETAAINTPKAKLSFEEGVAPVRGGAELKKGDLYPSKIIDMTIEEEQGDHPVTSPDVHQTVQQIEAYRGQYDNTPLLFDSEDTEVEIRPPCPNVTNSGPAEACIDNNDNDNFKENLEDFHRIQTLKQTTPVKDLNSSQTNPSTPDSKLITNQNKVSCKKRYHNIEEEDDQCPMLLRRSSRSRKKSGGSYSRVDESGGDGDFLDDIVGGNIQREIPEKALCKTGLFCASCCSCFTENVNDVSLISETKMIVDFSYLCGQSKLTNSRRRKLDHSVGNLCQCDSSLETGKGSKKLRQADVGLYTVTVDDLRNVSTLMDSTLQSQRDFALNAYWSETDQCCYQPITCAVCQTKKNATLSVIGYKLVAVGPRHYNSTVPGQAWLFARDVSHCRRFTPKNDDNP